MTAKKFSIEHVQGVESFMKFVKDHLGPECDIRCPCVDCLNVHIHSQDVVASHLLVPGINKFYTRWIYHGECSNDSNRTVVDEDSDNDINNDSMTCNEEDGEEDDRLNDMIGDLNNYFSSMQGDNNDDIASNGFEIPIEGIQKLLKEAQQDVYPGCSNFSILSCIVKLLHLKVYNKWSNKFVDMLLNFLKELLTKGEKLLKSHYEAKAMLKD